LENNHKSNMAFIERLIAKIRETATQPFPLTPRHEERMSHVVERAITGFVGNFNITSIAHKYTEMTGKKCGEHVRRYISDCINKLRHRNPPEIHVVTEGRGSRSGVYRVNKESAVVS
jgi:hypothetical protein